MLVPLALTKYFHVPRILISKESQKARLQVCLGGSLGRSLGAGPSGRAGFRGLEKGKRTFQTHSRDSLDQDQDMGPGGRADQPGFPDKAGTKRGRGQVAHSPELSVLTWPPSWGPQPFTTVLGTQRVSYVWLYLLTNEAF